MKKLVILSLVLAVVTGFLVYNYAMNLEKRYETPTKEVVVAKVQIQQHTVITADMLEVVLLPEQAVHGQSFSSAGAVIGKVSKQAIEPFEQILSPKLGELSEKSENLSYAIAESYRALTIKADDVIGVAGEIKKGDRVDLISLLPVQDNDKTVVQSMMIAENIEVLRVGSSQDEQGASNTFVTVSIPAADVLKISYALSEGKCRLVLRSVVETQILGPEPYTMR